jgi:hypothetical protein
MNGEQRAGEDMARAEKGDEKDERKGRRLQPSGFDLQAAPPAAPPQDECEREREEREREADTSAGDAFQRLIPGLKKKPDPVPAIVAGLQLHAKHPGVVQSACKALFQLSEADDENDETISRSIKLILSCLRTHKMTAGVQEQGCRLLKNLAASDANQRSIAFDGGIQVQKGLVAAAGCPPCHVDTLACSSRLIFAFPAPKPYACQVVLEAMRSHPQQASVNVFAHGALMNFIGDNHYNKSAVANEGGIRTVLDVMKAHSQHAELQRCGCAVLLSLTYNHADNKKKVVSEGGIEEILRAMRTHQNDVKVQEMGCGALDNIAWTDAALRKRIIEAGAVDVVEAAIAEHFVGTTEACQRYGEHLLASLAS